VAKSVSAKPDVEEYAREAMGRVTRKEFLAIWDAAAHTLHDEPGYRIEKPLLITHGEGDREAYRKRTRAQMSSLIRSIRALSDAEMMRLVVIMYADGLVEVTGVFDGLQARRSPLHPDNTGLNKCRSVSGPKQAEAPTSYPREEPP
jgi:hypothetical protein